MCTNNWFTDIIFCFIYFFFFLGFYLTTQRDCTKIKYYVVLKGFDPNATTFLCDINCLNTDFILAIRFLKKTYAMSNKFKSP